ncbi:chloroperoxidase [Phytophthora sojae]|uniref:Chloroperoxidase n=1 Tax=Phytophthora sojae (strain P6497) TaxID=1094619 RepID=G4Z2Q3_PHYSP|nr:chloroperoxidase [Phytophthora sojae]EGZ22178.1 chloroperoxidase [Phytophthora sojae]|eukprot:XP_009524895.1 chloroperoxidase [Phytophthora sojae]
MPAGVYYRPPRSVTSGRPGATTAFRRSPCPGLNTLANHGHLPRDGKNITLKMALAAVRDKFNIGEDLAAVIGTLTPARFDLNDLSKHNDPIEHDASLARSDAYFGEDPAFVTPSLINDVLSYGLDGKVDVNDVAKIQANRVAYGAQYNPEFDFSASPAFIAQAEGALLLRAMGGENGNCSKTSYVSTFFLLETFPLDWRKSPTPITYPDVLATVSYINAAQMQTV